MTARRTVLAAIVLLAIAAPVRAQSSAPGASAPGARSAPRENEQVVEEIVAKVNDEVVLWSDLREEEQAALQQLLEQTRGGKMTTDEASAEARKLREQMLTQMISSRLMVQQAERLYNMAEVKKDVVRRFKERQKIKSDEELDRQLGEWGMTRAELEDRLVLGAAPDFVVDAEVRNNLGVSEKEARDYYEQHKDQFTAPAQVTFREIVLVATDPAVRAGRRAEADRVTARARGGEEFVALVKELSEAPSKSVEGKIGPVPPSDLITEVGRATVSVPIGGVSDPIETGQGWHILKIEARREAVTSEFEKVRNDCEMAVRQAKFGPAFETYVRGLWKAATIEVRAAYIDRLAPPWRELVKALE